MQSFQTIRGGRRWAIATTALVALAVCSCGADPEIAADQPTASIDLRGTVVTDDTGLPNDPLTIDSARIVGDAIAVVVSHGGGCGPHSYQLLIGSAWMESFPVQVRARIAHNANGDVCRALLRRQLLLDLRPLADAYRVSYHQEHGSVSVQLSGMSTTLLYTF